MKTLRRKDTKEFVWMIEGDIYTHEHPYPLGNGATIEEMKKFFDEDDEIEWDEYEIVEIEYFESGVIGADIRNKLSPPKNLVSLLEVYFDQPESVKRDKLLQIIRKEMNETKRCVEYLAKLI